MRELPLTLVLSLAVHGLALGWFAARETSEKHHAVEDAPPHVEIVAAAELAPVEIQLLDDHGVNETITDSPVEVARPPARTAPRTPSIATTTPPPATTELAPPPEPPPATPPRSTLSMRRKGEPELQIHRPGSDGISDAQLESMGKTPVKIADLPGAQAEADLARANAKLSSPSFGEGASPDEVTAARMDRLAAREAKKRPELVAQKDGSYRSDKTTYTARVNPDGTVDLKDKRNLQIHGLSGTFDVTDGFMRSQGQDPYASEKLRYLDRTRDQRVEIGKRHRKAQLAQSAQHMAANLERVWTTTSDPVRRKAALFELWDDCAERGDEELVAGGAAARRLVINFIHAKGVTFTPEELTAFNARKQSSTTFAP